MNDVDTMDDAETNDMDDEEKNNNMDDEEKNNNMDDQEQNNNMQDEEKVDVTAVKKEEIQKIIKRDEKGNVYIDYCDEYTRKVLDVDFAEDSGKNRLFVPFAISDPQLNIIIKDNARRIKKNISLLPIHDFIIKTPILLLMLTGKHPEITKYREMLQEVNVMKESLVNEDREAYVDQALTFFEKNWVAIQEQKKMETVEGFGKSFNEYKIKRLKDISDTYKNQKATIKTDLQSYVQVYENKVIDLKKLEYKLTCFQGIDSWHEYTDVYSLLYYYKSIFSIIRTASDLEKFKSNKFKERSNLLFETYDKLLNVLLQRFNNSLKDDRYHYINEQLNKNKNNYKGLCYDSKTKHFSGVAESQVTGEELEQLAMHYLEHVEIPFCIEYIQLIENILLEHMEYTPDVKRALLCEPKVYDASVLSRETQEIIKNSQLITYKSKNAIESQDSSLGKIIELRMPSGAKSFTIRDIERSYRKSNMLYGHISTFGVVQQLIFQLTPDESQYKKK